MHMRRLATTLFIGLLILGNVSTGHAQDGNNPTADGFVPFASEDGLLKLDLPVPWTETWSGNWVVGGESLGTLLEASSDLDALYDKKDVSGLVIGLSPTPLPGMSEFLLLGWHDSVSDDCTFGEESTHSIALKSDGGELPIDATSTLWVDCGLTDLSLVILEGGFESEQFGLFVIVQLVDDFEQDIVQQILETLEINGVPERWETALPEILAPDIKAPEIKATDTPQSQLKSTTGTVGSAASVTNTVGTTLTTTVDLTTTTDLANNEGRPPDTAADETASTEDATTEDTTGTTLGESTSKTATATNKGGANTEAPATSETASDTVDPETTEPSLVESGPTLPELEAARALAAAGKVEEAIAAFEDALAADPSLYLDPVDATVTALIEVGESLYFEDKTWQALQRYSQALELDPTRADGYVGRASVYRWFEEYDKAIDDLTTAIELGYDDYNYGAAYAERGYIYYQLDDYARAIADLTRAIAAQKEKGDNEVAWFYELRGYAYRETGAYADAVADYTAAIELDETDYEYKWAYINRAAGYRELGDLDKALADATEAIALDPGYTWANELRGRIYSDQEAYEKSIADMTTAIDFDEADYDYSIVYGYRGNNYYQLDEYFKAVSDLTQAIELFPRYTWAYEIRGNAHSDNEQYDEAIADFTAAIELDSAGYDYSTVYTNRGIAHYNLAAYDLAIADLSEAIAIDPEYTWAYEWRGYAYADDEQYDAAIADFSTAIALDQPDYLYQWVYSNRAHVYYTLGQYDLAVADLTTSINLDAEDVWPYELRGEIYGILGRYEEALTDYRQVTDLAPRSAESWNTLCWFGALFGYAEEVVGDACESAVTFADEADIAYYRDSRGLARVLTGDAEGALADFQAFIEDYGDQELRLAWIERLEAGEDPATIFDDAMIEVLLNESIPLAVNLSDQPDAGQIGTNEIDPGETGSVPSEDTESNRDIQMLRFTLVPSDKLKATLPIGSMLAYSKDGKFGQQAPGDPLLMAIPAINDLPIDDPSDFALGRLMLTANATINQIDSHTLTTIGGLEGFETIASGQATSSGTPLIVYQVVLIQGESYIVIKGLVGEEQAGDYLTTFKEITRSLVLDKE